MVVEELKIDGIDEAVSSLERLTAAINAASAALDALKEHHANVNIKVCGALASVDIEATNVHAIAKQAGEQAAQEIRRNFGSYLRDWDLNGRT